MAKKEISTARQTTINAQPRIHQRAGEIQAYGTVSHALPLELEEPVRLEMTEQLNLLLAASLGVFYLVLSCWFFSHVYRHVVRTGLIARYSAETLS